MTNTGYVKESYSLTASGPVADMLDKSVGPTAGFVVLFVIFTVIFGLAIYQLVAASMFVKPLFKRPRKDHTTGRYHVTISSHLVHVLKAFCIIYWILLILSMVSVSYGQTKKDSTPVSLLDMSIVYLAFTAVVSVGVGFLTHKLWKTPSKDGSVTLNLSNTQLVFIKIAILSEIIIFPLVILIMFFALVYFGIIAGRMAVISNR